MEEDIPSTPIQHYDWSGHVNNDPAYNINTVEEGDSENEQTTEASTGPTILDIDKRALSGIEEIYGIIPPINDTFNPKVLLKFSDYIGEAMPIEIMNRLQSLGYTKPWQIISLFGGN